MIEGQTFAGRYVVGEVLGHGGMATVHRGHDTRLDREVAIKVFGGVEPVDRQRFDHEMRLLAGLRHPGLVEVYDGGEDGDLPFMVLELADGSGLAERLRQRPLTPDEADVVVSAVSGALAYVHEQGIVHRDVKPSNVLCTTDGRWLLGDFGIARLVDATRLTAVGTAVGTPAYLAPEQFRGEEVTAKADVYALGLVALEALSGAPAFPGPRDEATLARLASDPSLDGVTDPPWRGLLGRMTARDPDQRPTAAEVQDTLGCPAATTVPLVVARTEVATPVVRRPRPRASVPWAWAAAAVLALVAVFLATRLGSGADDTAAGAEVAPTTTATPVPTTAVAAPVVTTPPTAPPTAPPTTAVDPCVDLLAQRDALEEAKRALHDDHDLEPDERHVQDEALKDQQRELDEQLRANGC